MKTYETSDMNQTGRAGLRLICLIVFALLLATASTGADERSYVLAVDSVGMTVSDMDRAIEFYSGVLSFEKVSDVEVSGSEYERLEGVFGLRLRVVRMRLGQEDIVLAEYLTPQGRPFPQDTRSNDRWFQHIAIVVNDMDKAYEHLRANKVRYASNAPQTLPEWNTAAAGIKAFYFRDPDGHFLEIIRFPPGKGNPRWQKPGGGLFLGIDHTAIVVGDTEESLKFYERTLGMKVAGESNNYGTEQEHLNNVFGANLRITGIKPESGPGIEFLEYLAPGDGRPIPLDMKSNDIMQWQTTLTVHNTEEASEAFREHNYTVISPTPADLPGDEMGFEKGFLAKDPDGHVVRIIEK